jgi:hypothetical protein
MKIMANLGFAVFMSLFFAVGFGLLGYSLYNGRLAAMAKRWPTVEGQITKCELKASTDSDGTTYTANVSYSYAVDGTLYIGDQIAFGYAGDSGRDAHQEIVNRLSGARSVVVRYDPADPSRSVLSCGLNRSTLRLVIFSVMWLLFVTGFTILWCMTGGIDNSILRTLVVHP